MTKKLCTCGERHEPAEFANKWHQPIETVPELVQARALARRVIRLARANGCATVEVWSDGDRLEKSQREHDLVFAMTHEVDEATVVFRGPEKAFLTRMLWIASNGRDALSDYVCTEWANRVLDGFIKQLIEEDARR